MVIGVEGSVDWVECWVRVSRGTSANGSSTSSRECVKGKVAEGVLVCISGIGSSEIILELQG